MIIFILHDICPPVSQLIMIYHNLSLVSSDTDELQAMLNITHDIASRYHIKFGEAKSKILKIGKGQHKPDMYLGNMKLEYTNTYKYLGETLNHKGNMENHIPEIKRKTEAAYQTILTRQPTL